MANSLFCNRRDGCNIICHLCHFYLIIIFAKIMVLRVGSTILFFLFISYIQPGKEPGCSIVNSHKKRTKREPLLLRPSQEYGNDAFYLPDVDGTVRFLENDQVDLACPGSRLVLKRVSTKLVLLRANCSKNLFKIENKTLRFSEIKCSAPPRHDARYTGNKCLSQHREIEIGFRLERRFLRQLLVCLDEKSQSTLYAEFNLTRSIAGSEIGVARQFWIEGGFYSLGQLALNKLYAKETQRVTINNLLGLPNNSYKYIDENNNYYLARGHLAAKSDFVFGAQQRLTFYLLNAAPQWQTFNVRNWRYLETSIRQFARSTNKDFVVYTGTYGVATLSHEVSSKDVELYLYVNGTTKAVPVPRLYWKVIHEPGSKNTFAFVGVNNIYQFNLKKDVICADISHKHKWLKWRRESIEYGYSYACQIDEFRKTIKNFPYQEFLRRNAAYSFVLEYYLYFLIIILIVNVS